MKEILLYQPRVISAPADSRLPWWIAYRNPSEEKESLLQTHPDRLPPDGSDLSRALRETVAAYRKRIFSLPLRNGEFTIGPKPRIVGVLNVTPDSFFDGGRYLDPGLALARAESMISEGAEWIDVGGESSRPGSEPVAAEEETRRVIPIIAALAEKVRVPISVDTMKASVAQRALDAGAEIVNDVSGLRFDPAMAPLLGKLEAPVVINHMRGLPKTMQDSPGYADPVAEILQELRESADRGLRAGIPFTRIMADPGIGFGKRPEDNLSILRRLPELRSFGVPLFVGVSRKSFLGSALGGRSAEERLWGTAAAVAAAVLGGALLLRVHDPAEMKDVAQVASAIGAGTF